MVFVVDSCGGGGGWFIYYSGGGDLFDFRELRFTSKMLIYNRLGGRVSSSGLYPSKCPAAVSRPVGSEVAVVGSHAATAKRTLLARRCNQSRRISQTFCRHLWDVMEYSLGYELGTPMLTATERLRAALSTEQGERNEYGVC